MELHRREFAALVLGAAAGLSAAGPAGAQTDPLPSWNDGSAKNAILKFVRATTDSSSPNFVPPEQRIAMLVHHDDPAREYAYGPAGGLPDTKVGTFSEALMDEARSSSWTVISMKNDWKRVFAFDVL
jgi:hypothetical protein